MAIALLACLWPMHAAAQSAQLEIVQFGWQPDGTLTSRGWNPISVRVSGATEAAARVQVTLKLSVGSSSQTFITPVATYAQDVSLPQGTTRDVKLWLPALADGAYLVTAQLLSGDGKILAEQSTDTPQVARADGAPLLATIADSTTLSAQLTKIEVPYQQGLTAQVRSIDMPAADVPTRAEYLAGFQGMVVQGGSAATLNGEQKRAIQQWVVLGGHLLVVGGAEASRAAAVLDGANGLAARFGQLSASAELQPLATWAGADASAQLSPGPAVQIQSSGADLLAGAADRPLAVRSSWGEGSVTLLAVDPTLEPLRGWSGTIAVLTHALQPALSSASTGNIDPSRLFVSATNQPRLDDSRLLGAIDALPSYAFPGWQQIGLLLGGFAFLVGPVLHLVLWRTGRRPWLWVAVPGFSLLVTVAIYVGTALQPGHDVVANVVSDVRFDPVTGDARQAMAIGYFAPLHDQLSVRVAGEVPVRVGIGTYAGGGISQLAPLTAVNAVGVMATRSALPGYRVVTGRDTQIDYLSDATLGNGLRSLVLSRGVPHGSFGQFDTDLRIEGAAGLVQGTVRNATPFAFDEVGLAIDQTVTRLGPMAPGATANVRFDPHSASPSGPNNPRYSFGWQLYGLVTSTPTVSSIDPETQRRIKVVDTVFTPGDLNRSIAYSSNGQPLVRPTSLRPTLMAITSDPVGADVIPNGGSQRVFQQTVFEAPVRLTVGPGPFTLASPLVTPTVGVDSGGSLTSSANATPGSFDLRGAATYTFRLDLPVNSRVDQLNISTQQSVPASPTFVLPTPAVRTSGVAQATQAVFSIYNWQSAAWESLATGNSQTALSPAQQYIGPDSSVRVQVTSGGNDRVVHFVPPALTLRGEAGS